MPKNGGTKVQIRVTEPDAAWMIDLGEGTVKAGTWDGADSVLTLSDADLEALVHGEVSEAELYQQGKLRVDGDLAPARDLGWLKRKNG